MRHRCHLRAAAKLFTFPPFRTASGSTQPKVPMSMCTQAGRGVTIVSPSSAPLGAVVQGPDFGKAAAASVPSAGSQPTVTAAQTATGQQPKVPLHVSSQMTVNQARNAVRTGTVTGGRRSFAACTKPFNGIHFNPFTAACHSQDRPTAAVTPMQAATPVTYLPHLAVCPQPSSAPPQGCTRAGAAMGCAASSLTPPNVSAASLDVGPGNGSALSAMSNSTALACRLEKDIKVEGVTLIVLHGCFVGFYKIYFVFLLQREKKSLLKLLSSNKKKSRPSPPSSPTLEAEAAAGEAPHGAVGHDTSPPSCSVGCPESESAAAVASSPSSSSSLPESCHWKSSPLDGCAPIAPPPRQPCSSLVSQHHDARPIICERYAGVNLSRASRSTFSLGRCNLVTASPLSRRLCCGVYR